MFRQLLGMRGAVTSLEVRELFMTVGLSPDTNTQKMLNQLVDNTQREFGCLIFSYRGREIVVDVGLIEEKQKEAIKAARKR